MKPARHVQTHQKSQLKAATTRPKKQKSKSATLVTIPIV